MKAVADALAVVGDLKDRRLLILVDSAGARKN